ncbi:CPBP family intramembrane glutamic endopeptidase [Bradyrhizobium sp. 21]|uniref:CPBP family intramembrane glutamic endopeptidase n=1 Tax=Bradyrhizobium sp. 21 TaxID=2782666 RepID=UPI001FFB45DB|nr:CPBP family intramembrane glutamic endopeptidase [Bradyrhizobium sp. 21]MCK1387143.1 CPBP family intramembrane metalloprotease [Bradyrhizobium sp. 21]
MMVRPIPTPLWFAAALFPMVVSQIIRLQQSDPAAWIVWDYAGRLGALAVLSAIPAARTIAFRFEPLRIARWEVTIWIVGIVLADHYLGEWIRRTINGWLPATVLGAYPETQGWLHVADIFFGLGLVALNEEIVFRRCARHLLQSHLDDGYALVLVTSFMFGAYHWWTGFGNIGAAVVTGGLLMTLYRRSGALWPAVLGHYLADIANFAF